MMPVLILLLPRILSYDKNLACIKNASTCFGLFYFGTILLFASFWCVIQSYLPICFLGPHPKPELIYFGAPYRFAKKDRSLLRASTDWRYRNLRWSIYYHWVNFAWLAALDLEGFREELVELMLELDAWRGLLYKCDVTWVPDPKHQVVVWS